MCFSIYFARTVQLLIIVTLYFDPAYTIPLNDINCIRTNPSVLEAGIDLFVNRVWDSDATAEEVTTSINLISSRFKGVHKLGITSAKTLKKVGRNLYANKSSEVLPLFLTVELIGRTDDIAERISLLKEAKEAVTEINSAHSTPVISGLYLHHFTGSFQLHLEAVKIVFGINGTSDLQLGHFSHRCLMDWEYRGALDFFRRMDFITCEVLPKNLTSPKASADDVIENCAQIRAAAAAQNLTADILCRTEYYSQSIAKNGVVGSLDHFLRFWCRVVAELKRVQSLPRMIMWSAFDETSPNFFIEDVLNGGHDYDEDEAEYHTGWWRRSNSSDVRDFVEKVDDLPNCKRACDFCNSSTPCCQGMVCPPPSSKSPKICLSSTSNCPILHTAPIETGGPKFGAHSIFTTFSTVFLAVIFVSSLVGFLIYRRITLIRVLSPEELRRFFEGSPTYKDGDDLQAHELADDLPYDKRLEITLSDFEIYEDQILGSGSFGVVVKGRMENDDVAVKTTLPGVAKMYLKALMTEMKVLMYLGEHENIVNLRGSSTAQLSSGKLYLFLELCSFGNLLGFLRSHRDHFSNDEQTEESSEGAPKIRFSCKNLLQWSLQIANALRHLAEKQVIHGDIAARNILVFSHNQVKLTDFGLSRRLYEYANYVKQNQEPLPWRHMSLEALRDLSFSLQSDVWAFGVTLWEIFSLGEVPFPSQTWSEEFIQLLLNGLRPPQTQHAHNIIYDVMNTCWTANAKSRPSIIQVHSKLTTALDELYSNTEYWRPNSTE